MANISTYPVDPNTDIGKFRLMSGDSGNEKIWSDMEIQAFLYQAKNSIALAISYAYVQLAAYSAGKSSNIRTDDLSVNTTSRSAEYLKLAQYWSDVAAAQEADSFDVVFPNFHEHY